MARQVNAFGIDYMLEQEQITRSVRIDGSRNSSVLRVNVITVICFSPQVSSLSMLFKKKTEKTNLGGIQKNI